VIPPSNNGPQIADDLRWYVDRPCYYCGRPMRRNPYDRPTRDHIDPHEVSAGHGCARQAWQRTGTARLIKASAGFAWQARTGKGGKRGGNAWRGCQG
jgi:hypothetical protein